MIQFILNHEDVATDLPEGMVLLDFLRRQRGLVGTKEGCREGDCGACMVLMGEKSGNSVLYRPVNSCLVPLGDAAARHVVTIEGLNAESLTPIQKAFVGEGATQCGFCTPGFIVSLTGFLLSSPKWDLETGVDAVAGNICRCTGHVSIRRAVEGVCSSLAMTRIPKPSTAQRLRLLVSKQWLPEYFLEIPKRLAGHRETKATISTGRNTKLVAGGTDLFVQRPEEMKASALILLSRREDLKGICLEKGRCVIGAATPWADLEDSPIFQKLLPDAKSYFKWMASRPIRHRATVGGNIVNASPIADFTILLLALDADVGLSDGCRKRKIPLREFFAGYKKLNKGSKELVTDVSFPVPSKNTVMNFEKVSRRTHLDIASVNSAMKAVVRNGTIESIHISAGGVAPIPLDLVRTAATLTDQKMTAAVARKALETAQTEISPISDVRGTAEYKRLLLRQLMIAHFLKIAPSLESELAA